jgi:hypothetical protein
MASISGQAIGLISAATVASAAYLNARLGIGADIRQLRDESSWKKRLAQRQQDLGPICTLFGMFEKVNPELEALWFEGRTWTYRELKAGTSPEIGLSV